MKQRLLFWTALVAVSVGLILSAPVLDQLVIFPTTSPINARTAMRKAVLFESGELEIWTARSRGGISGSPEIYVLRFYGNADRAERWVAAEAEMFGDRSVEVWGVNYPGFGGSTGPARLARIGPAALRAFDAMKEVAHDRPIFVFGASLGTTAALHIAAHRPIAGLILHNPPPMRQMILRQFGWWNLWLLAGPLAQKVPHDLDSVANARASHAPAIFLLAENDEVVAPKFQALVVKAYAGEKREILLHGAYHNSPVEGADLSKFRADLDWLMPTGRDGQD